MKIQVIYLTRESINDDMSHKILAFCIPDDYHLPIIDYIVGLLEDRTSRKFGFGSTSLLTIAYVILDGRLMRVEKDIIPSLTESADPAA